MKNPSKLFELLLNEYSKIYRAQKQMSAFLPQAITQSTSEKLQNLLENYLDDTKKHQERLEQGFRILGLPMKGEENDSMNGLIKESEELIHHFHDSAVQDAAIICAVQKCAHNMIATYGCLVNWSALLDFEDLAGLLSENLEEQKDNDAALTQIAISEINQEAVTHVNK